MAAEILFTAGLGEYQAPDGSLVWLSAHIMDDGTARYLEDGEDYQGELGSFHEVTGYASSWPGFSRSDEAYFYQGLLEAMPAHLLVPFLSDTIVPLHEEMPIEDGLELFITDYHGPPFALIIGREGTYQKYLVTTAEEIADRLAAHGVRDGVLAALEEYPAVYGAAEDVMEEVVRRARAALAALVASAPPEELLSRIPDSLADLGQEIPLENGLELFITTRCGPPFALISRHAGTCAKHLVTTPEELVRLLHLHGIPDASLVKADWYRSVVFGEAEELLERMSEHARERLAS